MNTHIPLPARALLQRFVESNSTTTTTDYCELLREIDTHLTSFSHRVGVMAWLIHHWGVTKGCRGGCLLTTERLLMVVEHLDCTTVFCQLFLLLPEHKKSSHIAKLSSCLSNEGSESYSKITKALLGECCSTYLNNILQLDATSQNVALENLRRIFELTVSHNNKTDNFNESNVRFFWKALCRLVDENHSLLQEDTIQSDVSLLNLTDRRNVALLKEKCHEENFTLKTSHFFKNEHFIALLNVILKIITSNLKIVVKNTEVDLLIDVALKLKKIIEQQQNCSKPDKTNREIVDKFLVNLQYLLEKNELLSYICTNENVKESRAMWNAYFTKATPLTRWHQLSDDNNEKYSGALRMVGRLHNGHDEALQWLLRYEPRDKDTADVWASTLIVFTVKYGSTELLLRYKTMLDECPHNKPYYSALKQVITTCVRHLSTASCNTFLQATIQQQNQKQQQQQQNQQQQQQQQRNLRALVSQDEMVLFKRDLNECINKVVETTDDSCVQPLQFLAQHCVLSPFVVLQELIYRCFKQQLKVSTVFQLIKEVPSLLCLQEPCGTPSFLHYVRLLAHTNQKTFRIITSQISQMHEIVDKTSMSHFFRLFVFPAFENQEEKQVFNFSFTMEILQILLKNKTVVLVKDSVLLCKKLLSLIERDTQNELVYSNFVECIQHVADKVQSMSTEERDLCQIEFQGLIDNSVWHHRLYFEPITCELSGLQLSCGVSFKDEDDRFDTLLHAYIASPSYSSKVVAAFPTFLLEEQVEAIIESCLKISPCYNRFKATRVVVCLQELARTGKVEGIENFLTEEITSVVDIHPTCFAFLVIIQVFTEMYNDVTDNDVTDDVMFSLQNSAKTLYQFVTFAKDYNGEKKVKADLATFMFEQLSCASSIVPSNEPLRMLVMDTLTLILDTVRNLPNRESKINCLDKLDEVFAQEEIPDQVLYTKYLKEKEIIIK